MTTTEPQPPLSELIDSLPFSDVEGYELQNFQFHCVVDPSRICLERVKLISQYTRDITEEIVESGEAHSNVEKLQLKLREYHLWKHGVDCNEAGSCAVRVAMNESTTRRTAVKGVRKLLSILK